MGRKDIVFLLDLVLLVVMSIGIGISIGRWEEGRRIMREISHIEAAPLWGDWDLSASSGGK